MLKSFVPELRSRPKLANQAPPRRQMVGATATVSTLATVVGQPKTPGSGESSQWLPRLYSRIVARGPLGSVQSPPFCLAFEWQLEIEASATKSHASRLQREQSGEGWGRTHVGREGGLQARLALLALDGLDQCRLLPADVGSGAPQHEDIEGVP